MHILYALAVKKQNRLNFELSQLFSYCNIFQPDIIRQSVLYGG